MSDRQHTPRAWHQPPLFQPDWIVIEMRLHVHRDDTAMWGGVAVNDGDTGEQLLLTAEPFPAGHAGLDRALKSIREIAQAHMWSGEPFPA